MKTKLRYHKNVNCLFIDKSIVNTDENHLLASTQLTPHYQDITRCIKILKIFNNELSLCYFFIVSLETIHWALSDKSTHFLSFHFNLPNQLNKSTLCKMIPLVALATNPCSIV